MLAHKSSVVPTRGPTKRHRLEEKLGAVNVHLTPTTCTRSWRLRRSILIHGARYPDHHEKRTGV